MEIPLKDGNPLFPVQERHSDRSLIDIHEASAPLPFLHNLSIIYSRHRRRKSSYNDHPLLSPSGHMITRFEPPLSICGEIPATRLKYGLSWRTIQIRLSWFSSKMITSVTLENQHPKPTLSSFDALYPDFLRILSEHMLFGLIEARPYFSERFSNFFDVSFSRTTDVDML